jgi:hypothetical protein
MELKFQPSALRFPFPSAEEHFPQRQACHPDQAQHWCGQDDCGGDGQEKSFKDDPVHE